MKVLALQNCNELLAQDLQVETQNVKTRSSFLFQAKTNKTNFGSISFNQRQTNREIPLSNCVSKNGNSAESLHAILSCSKKSVLMSFFVPLDFFLSYKNLSRIRFVDLRQNYWLFADNRWITQQATTSDLPSCCVEGNHGRPEVFA